jgi:hypothetical protein
MSMTTIENTLSKDAIAKKVLTEVFFNPVIAKDWHSSEPVNKKIFLVIRPYSWSVELEGAIMVNRDYVALGIEHDVSVPVFWDYDQKADISIEIAEKLLQKYEEFKTSK